MNLRVFITVLLLSLAVPVQAVANYVCYPTKPGVPPLEEILVGLYGETVRATAENESVHFRLYVSERRTWTLLFRYKDKRGTVPCIIASGINFRMANEPLQKETSYVR